MKTSTEIAHPPIDANFTAIESRQQLSWPAIFHGVVSRLSENWKITSAALGLFALSGAVLASTTEPGQEVIQTVRDLSNEGLTSALYKRQNRIQNAFNLKCANGEGANIVINAYDGDVNVRSKPSTTSPVIGQVGSGLMYSVGEVENFMVVCSDQETAGYVATKYTIKP